MTTTPTRYSEITPEIYTELRITTALEVCYPQAGDRATKILAEYEAWRNRTSETQSQARAA